MKVLEAHAYRGASYWAPVSVIRLLLQSEELETRLANESSGFHQKLAAALPTLNQHHCSGHRGGAFLDCVRASVDISHVVQHTALELQNMARQKIDLKSACLGLARPHEHKPGLCNVILGYEQHDVGIAAGELAVRLLDSLLDYKSDRSFDFRRELKEFFSLAASLSYGPSTRALVIEAERRDIPVRRVCDSRHRVQLGRGTRALRSLLQLGHGKYQQHVWAPYIATESHLAADIALNKDLTNRLIRDAGLPVPPSIRVKDEQSALAAAAEIGYPVVVKPLDGNHGRGVGVNLQDETAVREHFPIALSETHTGTVLVEQFVPGNTYRILVVGGRAVAVTEEVPAHVIGDGSHTLRQLVSLTNSDPRRGSGSESLLVRIRLDEAALALAREQGYGRDDVPPAGQHVQLVRTAHISLGGISIDRTDEIHTQNAMIAEQAAQVIGLRVAGIDLIAPDIGRSILEAGGCVCEVNAGPGLGLHVEPVEGKPRDVARPVLELLYPPGAPSRIPIVAVSGTSGTTLTSGLIADMLTESGQRVGLATSDSVSIGDFPVRTLLDHHLSPADVVLQSPAVDSAVLEIGYEAIIRSGVGYDRATVAVITNVSCDHEVFLSLSIQEMAQFCSVVANSTGEDGVTVLNADDEWSWWIRQRVRCPVIYFSASPENQSVRERIRGTCDRAIMVSPDAHGVVLSLTDGTGSDIPLAKNNEFSAEQRSPSNLSCVLAAVAGCIGLAVELECIRERLRSVTCDGQFPFATVCSRR